MRELIEEIVSLRARLDGAEAVLAKKLREAGNPNAAEIIGSLDGGVMTAEEAISLL